MTQARARRLRRVLAALIVAVTATAPSCRRDTNPAAPAAVPPDIVLVTIDTLRDDRVGPRLTPALAGLAARGTRCTRAWTVAPLTLPAHASLMTATRPPRHGVRLNGVHRLGDGLPTLAGVLREAGYDNAAFVGAYVLDRRFGLDNGFHTYDDQVPRTPEASTRLEAERKAEVVVDRALAWMADPVRAGARPRFLWVHLYDPHAPYDPPAAYLARAGGRPYDGEIAYADAQVARLLEAIAAAGRTERTLIAVAGDHGESLGEHGEATHGMLLYEPAVRVPVILAGPGVPAGAHDTPVSLIDLAPTLLARAGVRAPAAWQGVDLFASGRVTGTGEAYFETQYPEVMGWSPLAGVTDGDWKLVRGGAAELYDLGRPDAESSNLVGARAQVAAALTSRVEALTAGAARPGRTPVPADAQERLRALGYVGGAPSVREHAVRPDASRHIEQWVRLEEALTLLNGRRAEEALAVLADLAREAPEAPVVQSTYARTLKETGRLREALRAYRTAARRWPDDPQVLHDLAVAARAAGAAVEARRAEEAAVALDPGNPLAHHGLGLLLADAGDDAGARAAFARAVDLDPAHAPWLVDLANASRATGDLAAAEGGYRRALALDPRSVDALNGLAVLRVQADRPGEAVDLLRRALAVEPGFVEARLNLGIAAQQAGDVATARAAYTEVLRAPAGFRRERQAAATLLAALPPAR